MQSHPNAGAAALLEKLHDDAQAFDIERGDLADALRMLCRDYGDWLSGAWKPERDRAEAVVGERVFHAKHRAREHGRPDIAAALTAIELPEIEPQD